ncbi:hypothetical protein, unlikely [Trypanosoma brucei gambiense DAL972]|uniref:Uncharacterized protein n=1 Tax=Trypanosoma brucei gambiense (strain MHOM/CI/86/DAL972) TaxID=679716 RepID=C9ZT53_TRYB9|nr:hypothetical protein, unlikely [Trypanosoma brucei gambiense DAL972]CBH12588.1 hypothetical protein, unlikely [Trypanosoma brucei gambiense DAL972]|eukprot:XP_011774868.1 hypothetical protein, unlikely [Trypanosoma brucei gambiense DAL972]
MLLILHIHCPQPLRKKKKKKKIIYIYMPRVWSHMNEETILRDLPPFSLFSSLFIDQTVKHKNTITTKHVSSQYSLSKPFAVHPFVIHYRDIRWGPIPFFFSFFFLLFIYLFFASLIHYLHI